MALNASATVAASTAAANAALKFALPKASMEMPDSYWRSLLWFNGYRLVIALLLLVVTSLFHEALTFGAQNLQLFMYVSSAYVVFAVLCFPMVATRLHFHWQLSLQVGIDILAIVVMMFASGGITTGLGLLLLSVLAAAGLISRGRLTLFYASLASIAVLIEQTVRVLRFDGDTAQYVQAGLLSIGYFATGWVSHVLAQYLVATERLAAQREIDLADMSEVNQLVIQDMQDGVLVVDSAGVIRQRNARAEQLLGSLSAQSRVTRLDQYAPALARQLEAWRAVTPDDERAPVSAIVPESDIEARFVPVGHSRDVGTVIFLNDLVQVRAQAHQMKLASLGRLTANIAHEIRNPLSAISHAAELLQEEPAADAMTARLSAIVRDNTERINRIVNEVLQLNRNASAQPERLVLKDFFAMFIDQLAQIEKIDPRIFEVSGDVNAEILFDRGHLHQVLWNLSRNALRHCQRRPSSICILVTEDERNDVVRLEIVDDGPGVAPEMRVQLFEPFMTTEAGGTGLGLYIARETCVTNDATLEYVETLMGACFAMTCRRGK